MTGTPDPRTIFGARCEWWDESGQTNPRTACPHCGKPLVDMPTDEWWRYIDRYDHTHPGYRNFIEWQRGKCFSSISQAQEAYAAEQAAAP